MPKRAVEGVVQRFDLVRQAKPFTRRLPCNGILKPVAWADVADQLPQSKIF